MLLIFTIGVLVCMLTIFAETLGAKILVARASPGNQTDGGMLKNMTMHGGNLSGGNMTFVGNMMPGRNMTMPGSNMTFGASLQAAKMHLMEAMIDLKVGNTKGAMMELNLTDQRIKMHELEIKNMMMEVKSMMTSKMKEASNTTSASSMSKNAT
jgi:hypothetical protein